MIKRKLALPLMFFISLCSFGVYGDVAPDPGYTRVSVDLILDAQDEFSDHRFFLQSPIDIEEISLKKGETIIESTNRGGAKRYATLLAVPRDVLAKSSESGDLKWLNDQIRSKKIEGVVELAKHTFQSTIPIGEKSGWKNPVYKLEKDASKGIKATLVQQTGGGEVSFGLYDIEKSYTPLAYSLVIGGVLFSGAMVLLGIWIFRGKRQKNTV